MTTGSITNPVRARIITNERLDTVDADVLSQQPRLHTSIGRAATLTTPRVAGATQPPGLIFTGFSLTLNPVAGDGKVRVDSALGVALDGDGNLVIKEVGVSVDLIIPNTTTRQLYAYFTEVTTDNQRRRFIAVASPYAESPAAIDTKYLGAAGFLVRAGDNTNFVTSDVVNGQTVALVAIGVASNAGGTITVVGYDATTAPNGSDIINRLSSIQAIPTGPAVNTRSGSPQTLHDLVQMVAYFVGQLAWKGGRGPAAYSGTSTSVGVNTLTDTGAVFLVNELANGYLKDSASAYFQIVSNTTTAITIAGGGTPAAGAYTTYKTLPQNNFGAFQTPATSLQRIADQFATALLVNNLVATGAVLAGGNIETGGRFQEPSKIIPFQLDTSTVVFSNNTVGSSVGTGGMTLTGPGTTLFALPSLHEWQQINSVDVACTVTGGSATFSLLTYFGGFTSYSVLPGTTVAAAGTVLLTPTTLAPVGGALYVLSINCGTGIAVTTELGQVNASIP